MITLTPRLAAVARYVLPGRPLADIGTDHAYLPAHLVQTGIIPRAIAADILPGPLDAARSTVETEGLAQRIELRLGNGLAVLEHPDEAPTVTICGMGGPLIAEILEAGPLAGVERLVLQPMGGEERLRLWLAANGWRIIDEALAEDAGRLYVILAAECGSMALTEAEAWLGPILLRRADPLLADYAEAVAGLARKALEGARQSQRPEARTRAIHLEERIRFLEEVIARVRTDHR